MAIIGSICAGTEALVRKRLPPLDAATRWVARSVLFTAGLVAAYVLPGALGILTREAVLGCALLLAVAAARLPARDVRGATAGMSIGPRAIVDNGPSLAVAIVGAGLVAVGVLTFLRDNFATQIVHSDSLNYHFAVVADWIGHRSMWGVTQFEPGLAAGNYPQNGDVVMLSAVLPWGNDAFVRFAVLPYLALAGLVVFALCRQIGVPRSTAILAGAVFTSIYTVAFPAVTLALPDVVALSMLGAGALFLLRHLQGPGSWDLALAGLSLGIAFGTKWYAVPAIAALIVLWAGAWLLRSRDPRWIASRVLGTTSLVVAFGAFWLIRNWVESGSPVFPSGVNILGTTLFDVPHDYYRQRFDHTVSEYLLDGGVWKDYLLPQYRAALGLAGPAVVIGLMLAAGRLAGLRRKSGAPDQPVWPVVFLGLAVVALAAVYVKTPYSALGEAGQPILVKQNSRYLMPALILGVPLVAWGLQGLGRFRIAAEVALLVVICDGLRRTFDPTVSGTVFVVAAGVLTAGMLFGTRRLMRPGTGAPQRRRHLAFAAAAAAALLAVAGFTIQQRITDRRFQGKDPAIDWVERNAPSGAKIGLAGINAFDGTPPAYPMFGRDLDNRVDYVGPFVKGGLRHYRTRAGFAGALRAGDYDLLVVGHANQFNERRTRPADWARSAGFSVVTRSRYLTLMRAPQ